MKARLSSRRKLLITLAAPLLGVALLELGLRVGGFRFESGAAPLVVWNAERDARMAEGTDMHAPHATCLWVPRAGAPVAGAPGETINAQGYRGPLRGPREASTTRVVLLGESTTFGMGLSYDDTCAARLEELLGGTAEVIDAGVVGYTAPQGRARYHDLVRGLEPEVVVIAFGLVNESFPAPGASDEERLRSARSRATLTGRLAAWARERTRIAQLGERWRVERAGGVEALEARSREAALRRRALRATSGAVDWPGVRRVSLAQYEACLAALIADVRADGARPIVVDLPGHPIAFNQRPILRRYKNTTRRVARAQGVQLLDLAGDLARERAEGTARIDALLQPGDSWHLNRDGQLRFARELEALVRDPRVGTE